MLIYSTLMVSFKNDCIGVNERETTLMTRTSKYLNQDTIAALQSFQIEKIDCEITDFLDTNSKMNTALNADVIILVWLRVVLPTLVNRCFVVKNVENVLLWTTVSLLFILTKTNPNGMSFEGCIS